MEEENTIATGVRYTASKVYRVVGRDLRSITKEALLKGKSYAVEKAGIIPEEQAGKSWKVVVTDGEVVLAISG